MNKMGWGKKNVAWVVNGNSPDEETVCKAIPRVLLDWNCLTLKWILTLINGLISSKFRENCHDKNEMMSVSLSFKYLLNIDRQTFLGKVKIKHLPKVFNVITVWLCLGYFFRRYALLSVSCQAKPCPSRKLDLSRTPFKSCDRIILKHR